MSTLDKVPAQTAPQAEIITVSADTESVRCDGGNGALGHPAVFYSFDGQDRIICGYCDREFIRES